MTTLLTNRTRPHHTSGLFPHSVVAGTSAQPDDEKAYRLAHGAYRMIVSLEAIIGLILRPRRFWHFIQNATRHSNKTKVDKSDLGCGGASVRSVSLTK